MAAADLSAFCASELAASQRSHWHREAVDQNEALVVLRITLVMLRASWRIECERACDSCDDLGRLMHTERTSGARFITEAALNVDGTGPFGSAPLRLASACCAMGPSECPPRIWVASGSARPHDFRTGG